MQPPQNPYPSSGYQPDEQPQWTQVPFPGQMPYGQQAQQPYGQQQGYAPGWQPGQVPPPAQLQPEVNYPQGYAPVQMDQVPNLAPAAQQVQSAQVGKQAPKPAYTAPGTGMPGVKKRSNRTVYIVLAVLVLVFVAVVVLRLVAPGQVNFALVQAGNLSARYTGDAVLVRNETIYTQEGVSQIDYIAQEGALLKRNDPVATVYSSGFSAKEWTTLNNYRLQIKEKQKELMKDSASDSRMLNLMSQVVERGMEVQRMVQGTPTSLMKQEDLLETVIEERQLYMRQKYSEDQKLTRLWDDENTQLQRISSWTKQHIAGADGLVSFYTDGFELPLNMTNYTNYSPVQVRSIYQGHIPQTETELSKKAVPVYRMVRQEPWAVLMLCNEMEWTPVEGRTYKLLIESFDNTIVDATVESFTRSGGELLVRLMIYDTQKLPNVMYIRSCKVQLGESVNTLAVPSRAIYLREGQKGVVMTTEGGEYWTGVEVISDDGQTAYIIPENAGKLYEGVRVRLF